MQRRRQAATLGTLLLFCALSSTAQNPTVTSISPTSVAAGGPSFTLTVNGTGFVSGSSVLKSDWDYCPGGPWTTLPTTFVSATQLAALVAASQIATGSTGILKVVNPGGASSACFNLPINNPVPVATSLTPATAVAGGPAFNMAVTGSNFASTSKVRWNGNDRTTNVVSSTALIASISASDIAAAGTAFVSVFNPSPGGGGSGILTFTITGNPVPAITSISPNNASAGGAAFTLTIDGSGFVDGSRARWSGSDRTTTFVSNVQLRASIPASDLVAVGTAQVTVFNPAPGGGTSPSVSFSITNPVPVVASLSPAGVNAGSGAFTLAVSGAGFVSGARARWNGSDRATNFASGTLLLASITATDIASPGTAWVSVWNPTPGGGGSNALTFNISAAGSTLDVSPEFLNFDALEGAASPPGQVLVISNQAGSTLQWTAEVRTSGGGDWLKLSSAAGATPSFLTVTAASGGLAPGVYSGTVVVRASGVSRTVVMTLLVTRAVPILQPSQTGFLFQGVEGGLNVGAQTFHVLNLGQGTMNWQVRATTADGRNWLSVTPSSGTSQAGASAAAPAIVAVNPSQLKAGVYVGLLTLEAQGAPNSPQSGLVLANILPPATDPLGVVQPAGVIFIGTAGGSAPAPQELSLTSTGGRQVQFTTSVQTAGGGNWLSVNPSTGSLSAATSLWTQANPAGLPAGIYTGTITVSLNTGKSQQVAVALVLTSGPAGASSFVPGLLSAEQAVSLAACTPSKMAIVETLLAGSFSLSVGWPAAMRAQVIDDCGRPVTSATVTAAFSNGDPVIVLTNLKDGRYMGTWAPAKEAQKVGVTLRALAPDLAEARLQLEGTISTAAGSLPQAFRNGLVHAASYAKFAPLAPGSIFSLFGRNLATSRSTASSLPLPKQLGDAQVTLGGVPVPLFYAGEDQVNGQVPFELSPGTKPSLLVTVKGVAALPDEITLSDAQPGIFTVDQSGTGQGAILDASYRLVDSKNPSKPGDVVQVFCTGLGLTKPAVASGLASPADPAIVVNPVTATIGGINAAVQFAGLTPGYVGLYQVNLQVPAGVATGGSVPVVITQGGASSNTATIAVK